MGGWGEEQQHGQQTNDDVSSDVDVGVGVGVGVGVERRQQGVIVGRLIIEIVEQRRHLRPNCFTIEAEQEENSLDLAAIMLFIVARAIRA